MYFAMKCVVMIKNEWKCKQIFVFSEYLSNNLIQLCNKKIIEKKS